MISYTVDEIDQPCLIYGRRIWISLIYKMIKVNFKDILKNEIQWKN